MPFVLLRDRAADAIESCIERAIAIERAHEAPEKRCDADGILEPQVTRMDIDGGGSLGME